MEYLVPSLVEQTQEMEVPRISCQEAKEDRILLIWDLEEEEEGFRSGSQQKVKVVMGDLRAVLDYQG